MASQPEETGSREERINEVIAEYLRAVQSGSPAAREHFLNQHPDLAAELASFFADQDAVLPRGSAAAGSCRVRHRSDAPAAIRYLGDL